MEEQNLIVHLCRAKEWQKALSRGGFRAASLETEGFIHLSRPDQILWVANCFYQGEKELVLLWVNPEKVQNPLRWEPVEERLFPHLFGELNLDAVVRVTDFIPDIDGIFRKIEV